MARVLPFLLTLPLLALPGRAAAFLFELEALDVTGALEFHDDFEDGSRTAAPTGALLPLPNTAFAFVLGSIETEAGGALRLADDDEGAIEGPFEVAWLPDLVPDITSGTTAVTWTVRNPGVPATPYDRLFMTVQQAGSLPMLGFVPAGGGAGITLGWHPASGFLAIDLLVPSAVGVPGPFGPLVFEGMAVAATDLLDPGLVGDTLRFEIVVDHEAGTLGHRYSLDGGTSWTAPLAPVSAPSGPLVLAFGATVVTPVPEASSALLLGAGLAGLATRACRRGVCVRTGLGRRTWRA